MERCIQLNFEVIYLDESFILSSNSKVMAWKKQKQEIYLKFPKKQRVDLMVA